MLVVIIAISIVCYKNYSSDKNSQCPVVIVIFEFGHVFIDNVLFENRRDLEYNWSSLHIASFF